MGQSRSRTRGENDVAVDPAQGKPDRALVGTITQYREQVETTGVKELMNAGRFGQRFVDKIANPKNVLQYYRKKAPAKKRKIEATSRVLRVPEY